MGSAPGSQIYVRNKQKACADIGIYSDKLTPNASISTDELLAVIDGLNRREEIDGILVQMPLPKQIDSRRVLEAVVAEKDDVKLASDVCWEMLQSFTTGKNSKKNKTLFKTFVTGLGKGKIPPPDAEL